MSAGKNAEFLAQQGHVPAVQTPNGVGGKFETVRSKVGRERALEILNDPDYMPNLKARIMAGEAPHMELWLWKLSFGDAKKQDDSDDVMRAKFHAMREAAKVFMKENPEAARIIDAQVQGAAKVLPRPVLLPPPKKADE